MTSIGQDVRTSLPALVKGIRAALATSFVLGVAAGGFNSPEKYTHGRSDQRVKWFRLGLETGDMSKLKAIFQMPYDEL